MVRINGQQLGYLQLQWLCAVHFTPLSQRPPSPCLYCLFCLFVVSRLLASLIRLAWHEQELDYRLCLSSPSLPNYSLCPHSQLLYSHSRGLFLIKGRGETFTVVKTLLVLFFYLCFLLVLLHECFSIFFACVILSMLASSSYAVGCKRCKLVLRSCSARLMTQEKALESRWEWKRRRIVMVWLERGRKVKGSWTSLRLQSK